MYTLSFQYDPMHASGSTTHNTLDEGIQAFSERLQEHVRYGILLFLELSHEYGVVCDMRSYYEQDPDVDPSPIG